MEAQISEFSQSLSSLRTVQHHLITKQLSGAWCETAQTAKTAEDCEKVLE